MKIETSFVNFLSRESDSRITNVRPSVTKTPQPLRIAPIDHQAYRPSSLSTIEPIDHRVYRPLVFFRDF